ncbi:MAG: OmpA family protein [Candidatus Omnitrophica bacterium]|nr:OmpA family protein [Candidatus Omnitrophota bacterium]
MRQLNLQQAATLESLSAEVVRLNRELEGRAVSREDLRAALPLFERALATEIALGFARVSLTPEGLVVTLLNSRLFDPEDNRFLPEGRESLDKIAIFLNGELSAHRIEVQGHTDNLPVEGPEGVTNWEYAADCATEVLHYWVETKGLSPARFRVSSFGEFQPVTSNDTDAGRIQNRRIAVVVLP